MVAEKIYEKSLAERVKDRLSELNMSIEKMAKYTIYERPTLSQYLNGKYNSNKTKIEAELERFLKETDQSIDNEIQKRTGLKKQILESNDFVKVIGLCTSIQERPLTEECDGGSALGIVIGRSGYGKTYTLKQYAKMPRTVYIECDDTMVAKDLVDDIEEAIGIPEQKGSVHRRVKGICDFFNTNKGYLLIVDEADKLITKYTQKKLEVLRSIIDKANVGIIIAGELRLKSDIIGYLERFGNRIDLEWKYKGLSKDEVIKYLDNYDIDEDAKEELVKRARGTQSACFRLLDRTMKNVIRMMKENGETKITLKIIREASSMMML